MNTKIDIELGPVQQTMLLPLWGRAVETQKANPMLVDNAAVEIVEKINYDFSLISKNTSPLSQLSWIARSIYIDKAVKDFLTRYPKATIVNIGCGMDTTFERVDNGLLRWYDLDLPDSIELRKKFIKETDRRKFIVSSFLDFDWFKQLAVNDNVFFIAAGVLYYFEEAQIKNSFLQLADNFSGSEIIFDASSRRGIAVANKRVIKSSGMDESSYLKWGIDRASEILKWDNRIELKEDYLMFKYFKGSFPLNIKLAMKLSDLLNIMYMVHLKFGK